MQSLLINFLTIQPPTLVPFNVRQKHEPVVDGSKIVAYVRYVEINVFGIQYRLLRMDESIWDIPFTLNGVKKRAPYSDESLG